MTIGDEDKVENTPPRLLCRVCGQTVLQRCPRCQTRPAYEQLCFVKMDPFNRYEHKHCRAEAKLQDSK